MKALITKTAIAAAVLSTTLTALPAAAEDRDENLKTAKVHYADLDLSTEKGRETFRSRYNAAAREICGINVRETGTNMADRHARACYAEKRAEMERTVATIIREQRQG